MSYEKINNLFTNTLEYKSVLQKWQFCSKKIRTRPNIMDFDFIGYSYHNGEYRFLVHISSIKDIYSSSIVRLRDVTLYECVFF